MHPYKRSARVGDLIKEEIADIIMNRIKHKNLGFITVTGARVSDDLRQAMIYLSVLHEEDRAKTLRKLSESSSFIRGELGKRLKMKFVPSLQFTMDEAIDYGRKIDQLLEDIKTEKPRHDEDEDLF